MEIWLFTVFCCHRQSIEKDCAPFGAICRTASRICLGKALLVVSVHLHLLRGGPAAAPVLMALLLGQGPCWKATLSCAVSCRTAAGSLSQNGLGFLAP